jgi:ABC-type glycerol-3-phosphate transport system substrate-binding protein
MSRYPSGPASRRRFLTWLGGGLGLALAACAPAAAPTSTPAPPKPADKPAEKPAAAAPPSTPAAAAKPAEPTKPAEKPAAAAPAKASGAATKLRATVWVGQAELDALGKMTNAYKEKNPGVEVEWVNISGGGPYGRDKLQAMIAGGDAPDQMMLNTGQFEGLAGRGALLALDDLAKGDNADLNIYWPQALDGSKFQGKLYALPRDMSNVILYLQQGAVRQGRRGLPEQRLDLEQLPRSG